MILINASDFVNVLRACLLHTHRNETSRHNHIFFEVDGDTATIVATDGHRMIKINRPWRLARNTAISATDAESLICHIGKKPIGNIDIDFDRGTATTFSGTVSFAAQDDVKCSDYHALFKTDREEVASVHVNANYLSDAQTAFSYLCANYKKQPKDRYGNRLAIASSVHMSFSGMLSPIILTPMGDDRSVSVLVMPCHL